MQCERVEWKTSRRKFGFGKIRTLKTVTAPIVISSFKMAEKSAQDIKRLKNIVVKVEESVKIRLDRMIHDFVRYPDLKG